jgi:hypothetical protein
MEDDGAGSVGAGPGLLLDYEVALDREDAASLAEIEELDQLGVDVQLVAVFAQAARDAEAQALASVGQPESGIEASAYQAPSAAGAAFASPSHRIRPQTWRSFDRVVMEILGAWIPGAYDSLVPHERYSGGSLDVGLQEWGGY